MKQVVLPPPPVAAGVRLASSTSEDLKTLRAAGLTQQELQLRLGVDRVTLYRWEQGTHAPKTPELWCTIRLWAESVRRLQQPSQS
jgi:transcriptional regulator with XRE-family HTH domain